MARRPRQPECLAYGITPRLISPQAAAFYCGMSDDDFVNFYRGRSIRSRSGKVLYDIRLLDDWLDQLGRRGTHAADPAKLLENLGRGNR